MSALRSVLFLVIGIAVPSLLPWLLRSKAGETLVQQAPHPTSIGALRAPVSPRSLPAFHLNQPAVGQLARPKTPVGFIPLPVPFAAGGLASVPVSTPSGWVPRLPQPTSFFLSFFRFVLGHQIAAHAP